MPGVSKLQSAGQMRPAKLFHPAREAILSMMKKIMLKKTAKCVQEKIVNLIEYNISRNKHIT